MVTRTLAGELARHADRLMPCVHCGFCLSACPTYRRLGDENDSPRGRLHLMGAVVEGRLAPDAPAFVTHIDRCLGCRACEPVCPSGVEYGALLEVARETIREARPPGLLTRLLLAIFGSAAWRRAFLAGGRVLRATGVARLGARIVPPWGPLRTVRTGLAMLAATAPSRRAGSVYTAPTRGTEDVPRQEASASDPPPQSAKETGQRTVAVLTGCVQEGLYRRVNEATVRVLETNGYRVVEVPGQECCGALHAHAGDLERARRLARANLAAFQRAGVTFVVVNAAGCGAAMKEYGVLFEGHPEEERARAFAARVRDVTELLAEAGPRTGAPVPLAVAYDHPCHLLHAQRAGEAPLRVLEAVPELEVRVVEGAEECCGGAGIYGLTHPELGGRIGADKAAAVRRCGADAVATPNPGCMMQIGALLFQEGAPAPVLHPVELLDESYRRAGLYGAMDHGS